MSFYILDAFAIGYGLFRVKDFEDVASMEPQVETAAQDGTKFMKNVKLVSFQPFDTMVESLDNVKAVSEGTMTEMLESFLANNNVGSSHVIGVIDPVLGQAVKESVGCKVQHAGIVPEVCRGIRLNLLKYVQGLTPASRKQAELAMGHAYSRSKVRYNVNRVDNMIIQSIAINDQMDKDINTFAMRMREWYSYHFPELSKLVEDHHQYAKVVTCIQKKEDLSDDKLGELTEILQDEQRANDVITAARMSMGTECNTADMNNILSFAKKVINMTTFRRSMTGYLNNTMNNVAPNLGAVVGDQVGARLISHAGSLKNLAKMPASTVQILGAEKALFRALKTKGKTPKYGLLYNSSFIGKAGKTDKGRISRFLANKCSIASRIDCFTENLTDRFGQHLKVQVEDRLNFYQTGDIPKKNLEVMAQAQKEHEKLAKKEKKKRKRSETVVDGEENGHAEMNGHVKTEEPEENGDEPPAKKPKKGKKKRKGRKGVACLDEVKQEVKEEAEEEQVEETVTKKKKKKKNRQSL